VRRGSDGTILGYQGIIRDITDHKRTEREMKALEEQLRQSQKMEAIGRLAGGIAHDFNNILTIIQGYCQLSLYELKGDHPLRENIEGIKKSTDRASGLIRKILAFSRRQVMEMRVVDLNALLMDLDKLLRRIIGEDIELVTFLAEDLGRVKVDPGQIEQVILNLAINAKDAMPNGGKLTIETANAELDEVYARSHASVTPGHHVMLSVSDTGVGMSPEVKERIFEPFYTTKEKGKGTGLGLSTVYGIVKQSGGNIWVYSELGQGTTFKIYLPWAEATSEEKIEKVVKEEPPRGSETILVVEDEEELRKLAAQYLQKQGYRVLEAPEGEEALFICGKYKEPIHLLVTDVVMPGMSGRELSERLIALRPEIKILYMSGHTNSAIFQQGVLEPGVILLQKPFTLEGLARKVREVLDH
jgi:nitrogen-specific signal transduction histidine kinase